MERSLTQIGQADLLERDDNMDTMQLLILVIVLLIIFGGGGGYYWRNRGI